VIRRFDLPMARALTLVLFRFARFFGAGLSLHDLTSW